MDIDEAYKKTLNEMETSLKQIHYPLCCLEKYVFDYETDEINVEVQNIHKGYMQIQNAINELRKLKKVNEEEK